jgi:sugar phosphate isomerase/epimerase
MLNDFPASDIGFTLDTYWVQAAGGDPAEWVRKLKGRVPCVHLKDMSFDGKIKMATIYDGNMNFDAILEACRDAEAKYLLIEQDDCYGEDPFTCLKRSFYNLRKRGLQ